MDTEITTDARSEVASLLVEIDSRGRLVIKLSEANADILVEMLDFINDGSAAYGLDEDPIDRFALDLASAIDTAIGNEALEQEREDATGWVPVPA